MLIPKACIHEPSSGPFEQVFNLRPPVSCDAVNLPPCSLLNPLPLFCHSLLPPFLPLHSLSTAWQVGEHRLRADTQT